MWTTLFLVAQVGAEWVQISQQHYRKPYRPAQKPLLLEDIEYEYEDETTTNPSKIYKNQSIHYKWRDSDLHLNKGFVTKVEPDELHIIHENNYRKEVHRNSMKNPKYEYSSEDKDVSDANTPKFNYHEQHVRDKETAYDDVTKITNKNSQVDRNSKKEDILNKNTKLNRPELPEPEEDVFEESYYMIPNIGSIKRVHLDSRTVRTPIMKYISKNDFESKPIPNIKPPKGNNYKDKENPLNRPVMVRKNDDKIKMIPGTIQKVFKDDLVNIQTKNISKYEETVLDDEDHSKNKDGFVTHVIQSNDQKSGETVNVNQLPDINFEKPVFVSKEDLEDDGLVTISSDIPDSIVQESTDDEIVTKTESPKIIKKENKDAPTQDKVNTMENVVKFMKIVTDTISRNTRRSVGSKVRYLENLQDTIMANIEQRIDSLWPDDRPGRQTRSARGGGHVEFPSSESALMTISFLTFAVYLIKLVLQVIHTYKNKAMMLTPAVVTAVGRNVVYRRADYT